MRNNSSDPGPISKISASFLGIALAICCLLGSLPAHAAGNEKIILPIGTISFVGSNVVNTDQQNTSNKDFCSTYDIIRYTPSFSQVKSSLAGRKVKEEITLWGPDCVVRIYKVLSDDYKFEGIACRH